LTSLTTFEPLDGNDLAALREVSTATLATQLFRLGLRNQVLAGLRLLSRGGSRMVGEAFTLRYIPSREDIDTLDVYDDYDHPQRKAVETCPQGHVLVMDCRGEGRAASAGHILLTRMQVRGCAGIVTDGTLRDTPAISGLSMSVYASGASPMTNLALHHAVDLQVPIGCAGVAVYPGDVLVGDDEGVVCVPRHLVAAVAQPGKAQEQMEEFILQKVEEGAPLRGTYPPDDVTLGEYHDTKVNNVARLH
jgi:regulator of RNase E activity RraA